MTTEEAFLGDIAANPGNAAVRLIYADWLLDQGREDESYAWRWATARRRYPYVTPRGDDVWWSCLPAGASCSGLPYHVWGALKPRPRTLHSHYFCSSVLCAFQALANALRVLRDEVAIP